MPLLNYTTKVPAATTVALITQLLVKAGARQVLTEYDNHQRPIALAFALDTNQGLRRYHLPIEPASVQRVLVRQHVEPRYHTLEHAERVAWRILKDWVEAQVAIIETEMVTLDEVMLPYMQLANGLTVYATFAAGR